MNWIQQFLSFKENCPICQTSLETYLVSSKPRIAKIEDRILNIEYLFNVNYKKGGIDSKAVLQIDIETLSFSVDFYNDLGIKEEKIARLKSITYLKSMLMEEQRKINKASMCFLMRKCTNCKNYLYRSTSLDINWKNSIVDNNMYHVTLERYSLSKKDQLIRYYELVSFPLFQRTEIYYGSAKENQYTSTTLREMRESLDPILLPHRLDLTLLDFDNLESVMNKLETYVIFA